MLKIFQKTARIRDYFSNTNIEKSGEIYLSYKPILGWSSSPTHLAQIELEKLTDDEFEQVKSLCEQLEHSRRRKRTDPVCGVDYYTEYKTPQGILKKVFDSSRYTASSEQYSELLKIIRQAKDRNLEIINQNLKHSEP